MNKDEVLLQSANSRQVMRELLASINEIDLIYPQVEGIWTIKDILGHLTSWEDACLAPLKIFAEGGFFQVQTIQNGDAWNAEQADLKSKTPINLIIDEWGTVRNRLENLLSQLTAAQLGQPLTFPWGEQGNALELLSGLIWHEEEHMKAIKAWLEKKQ